MREVITEPCGACHLCSHLQLHTPASPFHSVPGCPLGACDSFGLMLAVPQTLSFSFPGRVCTKPASCRVPLSSCDLEQSCFHPLALSVLCFKKSLSRCRCCWSFLFSFPSLARFCILCLVNTSGHPDYRHCIPLHRAELSWLFKSSWCHHAGLSSGQKFLFSRHSPLLPVPSCKASVIIKS